MLTDFLIFHLFIYWGSIICTQQIEFQVFHIFPHTVLSDCFILVIPVGLYHIVAPGVILGALLVISISSLINPYGNWGTNKHPTSVGMWGVRLQDLGSWHLWWDCIYKHHANSPLGNSAGYCTSMVVLVREVKINHSFPISSKY